MGASRVAAPGQLVVALAVRALFRRESQTRVDPRSFASAGAPTCQFKYGASSRRSVGVSSFCNART